MSACSTFPGLRINFEVAWSSSLRLCYRLMTPLSIDGRKPDDESGTPSGAFRTFDPATVSGHGLGDERQTDSGTTGGGPAAASGSCETFENSVAVDRCNPGTGIVDLDDGLRAVAAHCHRHRAPAVPVGILQHIQQGALQFKFTAQNRDGLEIGRAH